eukprot:454722-Prymnesium_polylepis.2
MKPRPGFPAGQGGGGEGGEGSVRFVRMDTCPACLRAKSFEDCTKTCLCLDGHVRHAHTVASSARPRTRA